MNRLIKDGIIHDNQLHKQYGIGCVFGPNKQSIDDYPFTVYDTDTQNVHLVPSDEKALNKANVIISELKELTFKLLVENIKSCKICSTKEFDNTVKLNDDKWYVYGNSNGSLKCSNDEHDFKDVFLYKYIALRRNGITYELNFMRFFIDEYNRINCILESPQFDRCEGKYVNDNGICYPHTPDSEKGQLKNIISVTEMHFGIKNFCFNPPCAGIDLKEIQFKKGENGEYLEDKKGNYILEADSKDYLYKYSLALENQFISFIVNNLGLNRINRIKNDLEHYEKELYINDKSDKLDDIYDFEGEKNGKVLDEKTGNCHFISKSLDLSKVSDEIFDCLKTIAKFINDGTYEYKVHKSNKGFVTCGKNLSYYDIFDYIQIKTDNKIYQLTPVRFAIDDNQKVIKSCLQSYQFLCADKEALVGRQSFRSWDIYPNSLEDGVETLPSMKNPCKNFPDAIVFYHNPKTKFISKNDLNKDEWNKSIEEIVKEFLDFIKVNEGA